jgi:hypothetical protein
MPRKTALNVTATLSWLLETHFSDEEIAQMEMQEITYSKHVRNQDLRAQSRDRLGKRKNEREIVRPLIA